MSQAAPEIPLAPRPLAAAPAGSVAFGPFRFDRDARQLTRNGAIVDVPPRALGLLAALVARPGRVVSKQQLVEAVWPDAVVSETSLTEAISLLRQALGDDAQQPVYVQTVHRRGYRFVAPLQGAAAPRATAAPPSHPTAAALAGVAAVALAGGLAAGVALGRSPGPAAPRVRFSLPLVQADPTGLKSPATLALSPDESELVYVGELAGGTQLMRRRLDRLDPEPIAGTAGASEPFYSPDGRWIGFHAQGRIAKVPAAGGAPITVAEVRRLTGAAWGDDGFIYFGRRFGPGLGRVRAEGGEIEDLTVASAAAGELGHYWPEVLPGSATVLFTVWHNDGLRRAEVAALSLDDGTVRRLARGSSARWAPSGHLLWVERSVLRAARFDADALALVGEPVAVLDGVETSWFHGAAQFAVGRLRGTLVHQPGGHDVALHELVRIDPRGRTEPLPGEPRPFMNLTLAPDGRRAVVTVHEGDGADLWVAELDGAGYTRLTRRAHDIEPVWSPRGEVAFASSRSGPYNLFAADPDRPDEPPRRLWTSPHNQYPEAWTPDGRRLVFAELRVETGSDLWLLDTEAGRVEPLLVTELDEQQAAVSPDGAWMAWAANPDGRFEVYAAPFPALRPRVRVSTDGGSRPSWSPDGARLYWLDEDDRLVQSAMASGEGRPGPPAPRLDAGRLLAWRPRSGGFVAIRGGRGAARASEARVTLGWLDELREQLAAVSSE